MTDLIDRQAVIDAVDSLYFDTVDDHDRTKERIKRLPSAHPELNEWCHDCKEYDTENDCCPRWGQVIKTALEDAQPISENDLIELQDRYGDEVRFVVEDMLSGEGKRWTTL